MVTAEGGDPMTLSMLPYKDELKVGDGRLYIDGTWSEASDGGTWTHVHPTTNEEVARYAVASAADVDRAVHAARRAFDEGPWPSMKVRDRKMLLRRYIEALNDNADEINRLQSLDNGLPITFSSMYQVSASFAADLFDKITFTGSRAVGQRILAASADGIKRVSLELGGKSANLIFPDVDVNMAAMTAMGMVTMGLSGQGCVCLTRALAHRSIYDDLIQSAEGLAQMVTYGDPFAETTTSGPIINKKQLGRVTGFIEKGQEEGARLVFGGDRPSGELASGNYVNPTLFADVDNKMTIAQEEIFGPVLSVIPFESEDEAIRIANDTTYGLGAGIQTSDVKRAHRVAKALRAGTIGVNGFMVMPNTPFGGYKTSGLGREGGRESIEAFTETKTVDIALTDSPM